MHYMAPWHSILCFFRIFTLIPSGLLPHFVSVLVCYINFLKSTMNFLAFLTKGKAICFITRFLWGSSYNETKGSSKFYAKSHIDILGFGKPIKSLLHIFVFLWNPLKMLKPLFACQQLKKNKKHHHHCCKHRNKPWPSPGTHIVFCSLPIITYKISNIQ